MSNALRFLFTLFAGLLLMVTPICCNAIVLYGPDWVKPSIDDYHHFPSPVTGSAWILIILLIVSTILVWVIPDD